MNQLRIQIGKAIAVVIAALMLAGCGPSVDEVAAIVKSSMQSTLNTDKDFSQYKITLANVTVIKQGENQYKGIATVMLGGQPHDVQIDVASDGKTAIWNTIPHSWSFVADYASKWANEELQLQTDQFMTAITTNSPPPRPALCDFAQTNAERMICNDSYLSRLYLHIEFEYKRARAAAPDKDAFDQQSVAWRERRNACTNLACLSITIGNREVELEQEAARYEKQKWARK